VPGTEKGYLENGLRENRGFLPLHSAAHSHGPLGVEIGRRLENEKYFRPGNTYLQSRVNIRLAYEMRFPWRTWGT
jgi:hypothetical protein